MTTSGSASLNLPTIPNTSLLNTTGPSQSLSEVLSLLKHVQPLKTTGVNFLAWERQIKFMIRHVTGLPCTYLDQSCASSVSAEHDRLDQLALSMILWSLEEVLQGQVRMDSSSGEVFRALKSRFEATTANWSTIATSDDPKDRSITNQPVEGIGHPLSNFETTAASHCPTPVEASRSAEDKNEELENSDQDKCSADSSTANLPGLSSKTPGHLHFLNLPVEILERVAWWVGGFAKWEGIRSTCGSKRDYIEMRTYEYPLPCGIYENDNPILTSIQALASVHSRMYEICCPQLWKHLSFPTHFPAPVSKWIDDLLLQHGELVQSVFVELTEDWFHNNMDPQANMPQYDNLTMYASKEAAPARGIRRGLSPVSLVNILLMCPKVRSLEIIIPRQPNPSENVPLSGVLVGHLRQIISRLTTLRSLSIHNNSGGRLPEEVIFDIIDQLPLLESLDCGNLVGSSMRSEPTHQALEYHVASLRHLTHLSLHHYPGLAGAWLLYPLSNSIRVLELDVSSKLTLPEAYHVLSGSKPQLSRLSLSLRSPKPNQIVNSSINNQFGADWADQNQFQLPALTSLKLKNRTSWGMLSSFKSCRKLQSIEYENLPVAEWGSICDLVCAGTWPELKSLDLTGPQTYNLADWDICMVQLKLRRFCEECEISFDYGPMMF